jgi:hypothetical protein
MRVASPYGAEKLVHDVDHVVTIDNLTLLKIYEDCGIRRFERRRNGAISRVFGVEESASFVSKSKIEEEVLGEWR